MAEILTCAGFFLIYFIEEVVYFFSGPDVHCHHHCETIDVHKYISQDPKECTDECTGLIETQNSTLPKNEWLTAKESFQNDENQFKKSTLRDFIFVLALSFHVVFEGLAVGLEEEAKDVWLLFAGMYLFPLPMHVLVI